ncbi:spindle assembly checkpoint component Mad1 [Papiliotrema laurentii]|uniref:Spindle assembly checkpoint component MAD1 n=1 Tax=Papiliotrema laurentii TaxID=5418 RepID=A0AAD9CWJ1_PAPLA|nr:spindle assembly checkpoint component Mad1 [Papiliotrema laurentii]
MASLGSSTGMSASTLHRKVIELERKQQESEVEIEELREVNSRLRSERAGLLAGQEEEQMTGAEREQRWGEERISLNRAIQELRNQNSALSDAHARLQREHTQLSSSHSALTLQYNSEIQLYQHRVKELEADRDRLKGWERRAQGLSIELEEVKRKAAEGRREVEDRKEDRVVDETLAKELRRQSQYLSSLKHDHSNLQHEILEARQDKKKLEASERAAKILERQLRDRIQSLEDQLARSHREMESLTQTFPSDSSAPTEDASVLQQRLSALSELHSKATGEIAAKEAEVHDLHARLSALAADSSYTIRELSQKVKTLENDARWAKEGRAAAEQREELLKREVQALYDSQESGPVMPGGVQSDQSARVKSLERLVSEYKERVESMSRDSSELEDRLIEGKGLVKQAKLDEAQARIDELTAKIQEFETLISELTTANTTLDAEVNDLMRRVASGEYDPSRERCLELKDNPAAKIKAIRNEQLEALKQENEALVAQLENVKSGGGKEGDEGFVPVETYKRLRAEKEELEKAHAKRLMRLKEIFGTKSKEFLEAVYSLLGWRIKFDESGADIRLTSMYAPKGKMGLTLKFASQEGHFGTMQMTGALARGLEDTRHFWIVERQSVPGFLAQVTTEMFEKTTIGRAAGYVGLE